ncbi:TonB-dependent receptor; Outer membrane receptor for ferrienterochelin and colicins [Pseudoalteromonas luteoviolacea B = ATCC 29581]|nr:TonB-dependent receptor; Outer membrane receptor for ferrienterochelin and colicins [Pseudoalteromonas luteoviolacea B = ATCC 29581]
MNKRISISAVSFAVATAMSSTVIADEKNSLEHIQIISHYDKLRTEAGSATLLSEEELGKFESDDIHRILANVPGVNIRQEDGYGLRPNIGFRGVTPERSKKITIMEDGVLIGPAPYSAPAAYYFPLTTRMTAVEVFKGPAAIKHGPQTVAGALNLVTRQIPEQFAGGIDVASGSDGYQKFHGHVGSQQGDVGFLVEGVVLSADGFKDIDNLDKDSGFEKHDLLTKVNYRWQSGEVEHELTGKLSYSDEDSNETYLGLSDADFAKAAYRRYAASQPDNMDTKHTQFMLTHNMEYQDLRLTSRLYRNDYERAWLKLNSLSNTQVSLSSILDNPQQYDRLYSVITGKQDSLLSGDTSHYLNMGTNDREYFSHGLQVDGSYQLAVFGLAHQLAFGVRYHEDEIERKHFEESYAMEQGIASHRGLDKVFTTLDTENSKAWSVYLEDKVTFEELTLGLGVRGEFIDSRYQNNKKANDWQEKTTRIWLPGVSGFYKMSDSAGFLFGVHQGFTPTTPKQPEQVTKIEKSTNYEFGGRFNDGVTQFEIVSFFNDYSNLLESCSQSSCGVAEQLEEQFSAGAVDVYGLEAQFAQTYPMSTQLDIPYSFIYTLTESEFKSDITSDFVQWGIVKEGDNLPYLPKHQFTFNVGLKAALWELTMAVKYVSSMDEIAGTLANNPNLALAGEKTDSTTIVDLAASYNLEKYGKLYFTVDNVFDEISIVSRRPYGARPGKPRQFVVGYKYQF